MSHELADVLGAVLDRRLAEMRTFTIGRVERYDASKGEVDIQPMIQEPGVEQPDGSRKTIREAVIQHVPAVFLGGGGFRSTYPIAVGDYALVFFSDRSLDKWLAFGGEVDPVFEQRFHRSDAVALVGVRPFNTPWTGASTSNANAGKDGGPQIHFKATEIAIGDEAATENAVLGAKLETYLDALVLALKTFTTGLNSGTLTAQAATCATALGTALDALKLYKSTTVKVK